MRIHHLALRTADVARLVRFYEGILGLRLAPRRPSGAGVASVSGAGARAWLSVGDAVLMIEARDADEEPGVSTGTKELVAFAVSESERDAWIPRLAASGVAIEARTEHTLYFRDPDGRRVALSSYPL